MVGWTWSGGLFSLDLQLGPAIGHRFPNFQFLDDLLFLILSISYIPKMNGLGPSPFILGPFRFPISTFSLGTWETKASVTHFGTLAFGRFSLVAGPPLFLCLGIFPGLAGLILPGLGLDPRVNLRFSLCVRGCDRGFKVWGTPFLWG